jgi:hypothetical protein
MGAVKSIRATGMASRYQLLGVFESLAKACKYFRKSKTMVGAADESRGSQID